MRGTKFLSFFLLSLSLSGVNFKSFALQAVMTHNIFYSPDSGKLKPYVEVYWEIDPNTILFDKKDNLWTGKIQTDIQIFKGNTLVADEHYILQTHPIEEVKQLYTQRIMDLKRYALDTGVYKLEVKLTDLVRKDGVFDYSKKLIIAPSSKPYFSDIQLVDTLISSSAANIYQRNGNLQIPLATNFLDENRKTLKYYAELYQSSSASNAKEILVSVSKKENDHAIFGLKKNYPVNHTLLEIIEGQMNISVLPSGNYYLNIRLRDSNEQDLCTKTIFFQLLNSKPTAYKPSVDTSATAATDTANGNKPTYINLNKTFLSKYTAEQIRMILKMLFPIADPTERLNINDFLKRPDDMYERYFIYNFWMKRNSKDPEKEWKAYTEKIKYTNKNFASAMVRGYESERGNMYLKYGEPDERIKAENEEGAYPYEIWVYNTLKDQANVYFLFYRPGMAGSDYRLLHSTLNGERSNRNWQRDLYINGSPVSTNSRADQYFGNR